MADNDKDTANPYAKMKHEDVVREALTLKEGLDDANKQIETLKRALKEANDVLIADLRSKKVADILKKSDYTVEDLNRFDLDELDGILQVISMAKKPFKAVADTTSGATDTRGKLQSMFRSWRKG
jgi:hypothetical protein